MQYDFKAKNIKSQEISLIEIAFACSWSLI